MTYRTLPPFGGDPRQVSEVVRGLMNGKSNNTGEITLTAGGATTTTLNDERIGYESVIIFSPLTSSAAALVGSLYVSARSQGSATLTHAANSAADRKYAYIIVG